MLRSEASTFDVEQELNDTCLNGVEGVCQLRNISLNGCLLSCGQS